LFIQLIPLSPELRVTGQRRATWLALIAFFFGRPATFFDILTYAIGIFSAHALFVDLVTAICVEFIVNHFERNNSPILFNKLSVFLRDFDCQGIMIVKGKDYLACALLNLKIFFSTVQPITNKNDDHIVISNYHQSIS
jgi:hypothetical protein